MAVCLYYGEQLRYPYVLVWCAPKKKDKDQKDCENFLGEIYCLALLIKTRLGRRKTEILYEELQLRLANLRVEFRTVEVEGTNKAKCL